MIIDTEKLKAAINAADAAEAEQIDKIKDDRRAMAAFTRAENKYMELYAAVTRIEEIAAQYKEATK